MKIRFENDNTKMVISTDKGEHQVDILSFVYDGKLKYNWFMNHPPKRYVWYRGQKIGFGGSGTAGNSTENLEQCVAQLTQYLKNNGYPYTQVHLLKPRPRDTEEHKQFMVKLQNVVQQFQQDMTKPENQPKPFGKGPPEYGQWLTAEDVKSGRLKWTIDNYGDFWVVIKWSASPRQLIRASELLKNYDNIMRGKKSNDDYAREIFVTQNPYDPNKKDLLREDARILVNGSNYWLDPDGNFINVDMSSHLTWAKNYLKDNNKLITPIEENIYEQMFHMGFIRVRIIDNTIYFEYSKNRPPTNNQLRILRDSAIESQLSLKDDTIRKDIPLTENIEKNPLYSQVKELQASLESEFPQIEDLYFYLASPTHIYLSSLKIKESERGKGIGKKILKKISEFADTHKLYVVLEPLALPKFKSKLNKFYRNAGFVPNKGRRKLYQYSSIMAPSMYRSPYKKVNEIESPYSKATEDHKKRGYIGVVYNGVIYAYDQIIPNVMEVDHSELINGRNGERWRYFIQTPKNTILWNEFPPSKDDQFLVEDWIHKKGHIVDKSISLREYYFITGKNKIFENISNNTWKDITIDDIDAALLKALKFNNIGLRSLLRTIEEFYYNNENGRQKQWAKEYIDLLNKVAHRVIEITRHLKIPYISMSALRTNLLSQEEFKTKIEEFFPFSIYIAASDDEYDTIGIGIDLNGKILGIEEGNDEATPETIKFVNMLVNPQGKQVRVYGSHNRELCFKIQETGYLPPNLFISKDKEHARSHLDLQGERETFTGIININDVSQDSDLDWKTIGHTKIEKFRFV